VNIRCEGVKRDLCGKIANNADFLTINRYNSETIEDIHIQLKNNRKSHGLSICRNFDDLEGP